MLYTSTSNFIPVLDADWRNHLSHGDVVMFRFPDAGQPAAARPMARPCLVLDIETVGTRRCAVLVPACPARRPASCDRSVTLFHRPEYRAAGLNGPTQFPIPARLLVSLVHDGFVVSGETGSAIVGRLPDAAMGRMHAERARIDALRDIRADRKGSRDRPSHRRNPLRARDFTVGRQHPRRSITMPRGFAARRGI